MRLAAIDIGSNSIKLVVVDALSSDSFAVLAREKDTVRLAHHTLQEGHLAPAAIERAAATIKRFGEIAEANSAEHLIATATAAVREADNAAEFINEIWDRASVRVEILSGIEEARLIGLAAAQGCAPRGATILNIDIGGGSTELSVVREGIPVKLFSLQLGAVRLTDQFIPADPVKPKELRALRDEIRTAVERPARELRDSVWQHVTGTSGTIVSIGEALRLRHQKNAESRGAQPISAEIPLAQLERFNEEIAAMEASERRSLPGISAQRAEIVIAGGQILEGVMRALGIQTLKTCDWSLREGVIIDRLREMEAETRPPTPDWDDQRLYGVHAVGRRFAYEEAHAHQVAMLSERIFDDLSADHKLNRHHRTLLSAASLLHDIGYVIAHENHHKHSLYLIKHSELTGFSEAERLIIASVARYHRRSLPKERHPDFAALNESDRQTVWALGSIVRLAEALDRSHEGRVRDVRCTRDGHSVQLHLRTTDECEDEMRVAGQKADMFEQAFSCKLILSKRMISKNR